MNKTSKSPAFYFIKKQYNMPFLKRGLTVIMNGKKGKLTMQDGNYLRIHFEGEKHSKRCHPTWETAFYDGDQLLADYREEAKS